MSNGFPPGPWNGGGEWSDEGTLALTESPAPGPLGFSAASTPADDANARAGEADVPFDWKAFGFPGVAARSGR